MGRSGLRTRPAGSGGVPVDRAVTALLAEVLYQRRRDRDERSLALVGDLFFELKENSAARREFVEIACDCIEALAEELGMDPLVILRGIQSKRYRGRAD